MTDTVETLSPAYSDVFELVDQYCETNDEAEKRKIDWSIRCLVDRSEDIDPDLRYLLVTYGPDEGLSPEGAEHLDRLKGLAGELLLITPASHTSDNPGVLGKMSNPRPFIGASLYAFDHIPDDQPALYTGINIVIPQAIRFAQGITSYYGKTGPIYNVSDKPRVEEFVCPETLREAIVPYPVPYEEDPEGIVFTRPFNYFDHSPINERFRCSWGSRDCTRTLHIGEEAVRTWFDQYTHNGVVDRYLDILGQAEIAA